jgi:glycosyltransferase involved in cell wall biosynthesis
MMTKSHNSGGTTSVSICIFAWNEEEAIGQTLSSLFEQSLFAELDKRNVKCEVICVLNGCTDRTPAIASNFFAQQKEKSPAVLGWVANLPERGKVNAWNQFVHSLSAKESQFLFMLDADILIHRHETLSNMLHALELDIAASVSVDKPCKDISFKPRKTLRDKLSLAAARMTASAEGQLCGQLYCIRAGVARNIYLPKDLAACEDGFIKALVCTDFLTHPISPERIRVAEGAGHIFEAYTSLPALLKNQKRQMIGQTIVHILVDDYLKGLPLNQRLRLAETLQETERTDPSWLKRLIGAHLRCTKFFWQLYPGLLSQRFKRLMKLSALERVLCFPAAVVGLLFSLVPCRMAYAALKHGTTDYWPRAQRVGMKDLVTNRSG